MEVRALPRDLLPLPAMLMPERARPSLLGGSSQQRTERRRASVHSANEAVWALNFLRGSQSFSGARPSTAQASSLARLEEAALADPPPSPLPDPEASLSEMLGSKASTYAGDDLSCVASYRRDLVLWPASAGSVPLFDVLPDPERFDLAVGGGERLLLSPEDLRGFRERDGVPRRYWEETLRSDESAYFLFVRELVQRKMFTFRAKIRAEAGVFFVSRKNGRIRLVVDARRCNQHWIRPPPARLASTAAVVEHTAEDGESRFFFAQDIADCYYQFSLPDGLVDWFGLKPVPARVAGITSLDGEAVWPETPVIPCLRVLPMGFAWALHWTQQAHRNLLVRAGLGGPDREWLDRAPSVPPRPGEPARLVYVGPQDAEAARIRASDSLGALGLPLREVVDHASIIVCIGFELDGVTLQARLSAKRRWRLRQAWVALRRHPFLSGRQL